MAPRLPKLAAALAGLAVLVVPGSAEAGSPMKGRLAAALLAPVPALALARARFEPAAFDVVFARAVRRLHEDGYDLVACNPHRGSLTTRPREFDAPCGRSTCLARQSVSVLLGYRTAKVTVTRELFDTAVQSWVAETASAQPDATGLVTAIVTPATGGSGDALRDEPCAELARAATGGPPALAFAQLP